MNAEQKKMLEEWRDDARLLLHAHYSSAADCHKKYVLLGIPAVILSAVVGTSVFAALGKTPDKWVQILVGCVSIGVSILTALQTFLRLSEQCEKCKLVASSYAAIRKEIEQVLVFPPKDDVALTKWLNDLRLRWDSLRRESDPMSTTELHKFTPRIHQESNEKSKA